MTDSLVSDELWKIADPLLPEEPPKPNGGRPRLSYRAAYASIIYVLQSGVWKAASDEAAGVGWWSGASLG